MSGVSNTGSGGVAVAERRLAALKMLTEHHRDLARRATAMETDTLHKLSAMASTTPAVLAQCDAFHAGSCGNGDSAVWMQTTAGSLFQLDLWYLLLVHLPRLPMGFFSIGCPLLLDTRWVDKRTLF